MSMLRRTSAILALVGPLVMLAVGPGGAYTTSGPLEASDTTVRPGDPITVSGGGYEPGASVDITLASTPVLLDTVQADGSGSITATVTIPTSTAPGTHTLSATGAAPGGDVLVLSVTITVEDVGVAGTSGDTDNVGNLAFTGGNTAGLVALGLFGLGVGALLVVATRRRSTGAPAGSDQAG